MSPYTCPSRYEKKELGGRSIVSSNPFRVHGGEKGKLFHFSSSLIYSHVYALEPPPNMATPYANLTCIGSVLPQVGHASYISIYSLIKLDKCHVSIDCQEVYRNFEKEKNE